LPSGYENVAPTVQFGYSNCRIIAKASGHPPGIVPQPPVLADELVAAEAARAECGGGVQRRHHLVAKIADVDVAALQVLLGGQEVGPLVEGRVTADSRLMVIGRTCTMSIGSMDALQSGSWSR